MSSICRYESLKQLQLDRQDKGCPTAGDMHNRIVDNEVAVSVEAYRSINIFSFMYVLLVE